MAALAIREDRSSDSEESELDPEQEEIEEAQIAATLATDMSPIKDSRLDPPDSNLPSDNPRNMQAAEREAYEKNVAKKAEDAKKAAGAGAAKKKKKDKKKKPVIGAQGSKPTHRMRLRL